ncbi:MAG: hypothetical protein RLZZ282_1576, partial [Verrucomicrobiota bacterium]
RLAETGVKRDHLKHFDQLEIKFLSDPSDSGISDITELLLHQVK